MSKYLTYDQRLEIEAGLKNCLSFGAIGKIISKDRTTISKEIKRNHIIRKTGYAGNTYNACKHRSECRRKLVCKECKYPKKNYCKLCKLCNDGCDFLKNKFASVNLNRHMFVMDVVTMLSALLQNLITVLVMLIKYSQRTSQKHVVVF